MAPWVARLAPATPPRSKPEVSQTVKQDPGEVSSEEIEIDMASLRADVLRNMSDHERDRYQIIGEDMTQDERIQFLNCFIPYEDLKKCPEFLQTTKKVKLLLTNQGQARPQE